MLAKDASKPLVVIGNGMVGHHFVEQMVNAKNGGWNITIIERRSRARVRSRASVGSFLRAKSPMNSRWRRANTMSMLASTRIFGDAVASIDRAQKKIITAGAANFVTTNSCSPPVRFRSLPPVPGADNKLCFVYRTIDDLGAIKAAAATAKKGVVVGGGLLGSKRQMRCAISVWKRI